MMNIANETVFGSLALPIVAKVTSAICMGLAAAWLARRSRAALRHSMLFATFGAMLLLPVASAVAPPVYVSTTEVAANRDGVRSVVESFELFPPASTKGQVAAGRPAAPHPASTSMASVLFAIWIVGAMCILLPMFIGLLQIRALRTAGITWQQGNAFVQALACDAGIRRSVDVLLHPAVPGPMTFGIARPVIVLPVDAQNWERDDLQRALIHELEHLRRRDWFSQCIARATCALYWFHPLVWIARRRLCVEAERACDDAVLAHSEAGAYASQLVGLACRLSAAKSPAPAMANPADLTTRIRAVLNGSQRRGRAGKLSATLACGAAAALVLGISPLRLVAVPQTETAGTAKFDVASVKPDIFGRSGPLDSMKAHFFKAVASAPQHGQFRLEGVPLTLLIELAYNVKNFQLKGGPAWANSDHFVVEAKAEGDPNFDEVRAMLRSLLAERFRLVVHREIKEGSVYELAVAKGGLKIVASADNSCVALDSAQAAARPEPGQPPAPLHICGGVRRQMVSGPPDRKDRMEAVGIGMQNLAEMLADQVGRAVIDKTGFRETFDFRLEFAAGEATETDAGSGASIFTALQEQLGLHLESGRGPVEVLVIDSAARPSAN